MKLFVYFLLWSFASCSGNQDKVFNHRQQRQDDGDGDVVLIVITIGLNKFLYGSNETGCLSETKCSILGWAENELGVKSSPTGINEVWNLSKNVPMCESNIQKSPKHHWILKHSIGRVLNFYNAHVGRITIPDVSLSLAWLKAVDLRHEGTFSSKYGIVGLIDSICALQSLFAYSETCFKLANGIKKRSGYIPKEVLVKELDHVSEKNLAVVGNEVETVNGTLNIHCQEKLLSQCEVPHECRSSFFSSEPSTQYMLSHQLFLRILAESSNCETTQGLLDETVNHRLCAKMYLEAELISSLGYPETLRDIFAEHVGFCGFLGYTNFFRLDWLEAILSWQSKSEYDCFVFSENYDQIVGTASWDKIPNTKSSEVRRNQSVEICRTHFTVVSLMALSSYWDYLEENCTL